MGFPAGHTAFLGSRSARTRAVANALLPEMAEAIGTAILRRHEHPTYIRQEDQQVKPTDPQPVAAWGYLDEEGKHRVFAATGVSPEITSAGYRPLHEFIDTVGG
jgi:hypothetical protein